jgi:hypothetical protein
VRVVRTHVGQGSDAAVATVKIYGWDIDRGTGKVHAALDPHSPIRKH